MSLPVLSSMFVARSPYQSDDQLEESTHQVQWPNHTASTFKHNTDEQTERQTTRQIWDNIAHRDTSLNKPTSVCVDHSISQWVSVLEFHEDCTQHKCMCACMDEERRDHHFVHTLQREERSETHALHTNICTP